MESINEYIELSFRNYPDSQEIEEIKNNIKRKYMCEIFGIYIYIFSALCYKEA